MKKLILSILVLLSAGSAFAADFSGKYSCDDQGTLTLKRGGIGAYYSSLSYADGSASTLATMQFPGESLRGTMSRDDEDPEMGRVIVSERGQRLVLRFDSGETLTCLKATKMTADSATFRLFHKPKYKMDGCDQYVSLTLSETNAKKKVATLENGLAGFCEIYVAPNPRTFQITKIADDGCGSMVYTGVRRSKDGEPIRLKITDNSRRMCEDVVAAVIVVDEEYADGVSSLYTAE